MTNLIDLCVVVGVLGGVFLFVMTMHFLMMPAHFLARGGDRG